jgi:hypothetical protein
MKRKWWRWGIANKALVLTMPARGSFGIRARHNGLGGGVGFILPHTALAWPHNAGVRLLPVKFHHSYCE